jgi:small subunit ribosomal protein S4
LLHPLLSNPFKKFLFFKPILNVNIGLYYFQIKYRTIKWKSNIFFWTRNRIQYLFKRKINLKTYNVFFYKTYMVMPQAKKRTTSLFNIKTQYYKKLSVFYGFVNPKQFFSVYKRFLVSTKNNFFSLFSLLEGRLQVILFRLNFVPNIYFSKQIILHKNVYLNNRIINNIHYVPRYNEVISINKKYTKLIYFNLYRLLRKRSIFLNFPRYYDVDYKLFVALMIKLPQISDLTLPFSATNKYLINLFSFSRIM